MANGTTGSIVDVAASRDDLSTLVAAVKAADLVGTLSGDTELTVFAPTDAAFGTALESLGMTAEELLGNKELLTGVLTYHVVAGKVMAATVAGMDGEEVATVNGATVDISVDGSNVMVNESNVTEVDIEASNGVVHIIDAVLLPPSAE